MRILPRVLMFLTIGLTGAFALQNKTPAFVSTPTRTQAEMNSVLTRWYDLWKSKYLKPACQPNQYRVKADAYENYTVSEGQGYGMLLTVMMQWHDPDARTLFDGLLRYAKAQPSPIAPALMSWAQDEKCQRKPDAASATDGDLDIAYALLAADAQWGSKGAINYLEEAQTRINAIKRFNINPETQMTNLGDWVRPSSKHFYGTRSSDWRIGHFRAFAKSSKDPFWNTVLETHLNAIEQMQQKFSPNTGLLPDFVILENGKNIKPAPPNFLEAKTDNAHSWNACRDPWFIAADAISSGDPRTQRAAAKMSAWMRQNTQGNPAKILAGYTLEGTPLVTYTSLAFTAPFATAATQDSDQAWVNALWARLETAKSEGYYADSIVVLSLLPIAGHWWAK